MTKFSKINVQSKPPKQVTWGITVCPAGKLVVGLTDQGELCRASFLHAHSGITRQPIELVEEWQAEWKATHFKAGQSIKNFMSLPLLMVGTQFQKLVTDAVRRIPSGQVATYGEIASRAGFPNAARAVGSACGQNRLAYIVPCHRVVSSNGLGGYGPSGLATKRWLLAKEGVIYD